MGVSLACAIARGVVHLVDQRVDRGVVFFRAIDGFFDELRRSDLASGNQLCQSQAVEVRVLSEAQGSILLDGASNLTIDIPLSHWPRVAQSQLSLLAA
jgi:hypothetical protein